jgi:hypothetical protein
MKDKNKDSDDQQLDRDQGLVRWLLNGISVRKHGRVTREVYPEAGSEEKTARRALARILRTSKPLDLGLRLCIADLVDPDRNEIEREIRFAYRRKGGRRASAVGENEIAEFIRAQLQAGTKLKAAVSNATEHFGFGKSRSRAMDIWRHWQPILKRRYQTKPISLQDWE